MNEIKSLKFPAIALTPNGVMPYSEYVNVKRVMKHEYEMGWFENLEFIGIAGDSYVIHSVEIESSPMFAKIFGKMVEVRITRSSQNANDDVDSIRERVLQHLSLYPGMYVSAGVYDEMVNDVARAATTPAIVEVFTKLVD